MPEEETPKEVPKIDGLIMVPKAEVPPNEYEYKVNDVIVIMDSKVPGEKVLDKVYLVGKTFSISSAFQEYRKWIAVQVTEKIADFEPYLVNEKYLKVPDKTDIWRK